MKRITALAAGLATAAFAATVLAQQPGIKAGASLESAPGKATATETVSASAQVVAIDAKTRTVTLKGQGGAPFDVIAGSEVKNFDRIKVGDAVNARYRQSLTFELRKAKGATGGVSAKEQVTRSKPGEAPAGNVSRQVATVAEVTALDPKASTITLKGPQGNVVVLDVRNPDQFKVVKVGDQIEITYAEAFAVSLEPAPKTEAKAK
jgi:hypothetical protein